MVPLSSRGTPASKASCLNLAKKSSRLSPCLSLQSLKKLSQCFAILERVTWNKSNKLSNIVNIMYVILHHLGFRKYPRSCDLDQK